MALVTRATKTPIAGGVMTHLGLLNLSVYFPDMPATAPRAEGLWDASCPHFALCLVEAA